jgi:hypothetical protein
MTYARSWGAVVIAAFLWSAESLAAPVYFNLDCLVASPTCNSVAPSTYGTITITDNASDSNNVDVTVNLTGAGTTRVQEFWLNLDPILTALIDAGLLVTPTDTYFSAYVGATSVGAVYDADSLGSPNTVAIFDLNIPDGSNLGWEPITVVVGLAIDGVIYNLKPEDFRFAAPLGGKNLYAEVHIGSCSEEWTECLNNGGSIKVGALSSTGTPANGSGPLPEPGTLSLFGLGILGGLFAYRRRRQEHA